MSEDAKSERQLQTLLSIHRCALRLAAEQGLDGFTMDQLAEQVGVSRRTLFNYVPSKMDAVLGPDTTPPPDGIETFAAGGPTGVLTDDLKVLVATVLEYKVQDTDELHCVRHLLRTEPRFTHALHDRFSGVVEDLLPIFREREGAHISAKQIMLLLHLVLTLFDAAVDEYVADDSRPVSEYFARSFDDLVSLFVRRC